MTSWMLRIILMMAKLMIPAIKARESKRLFCSRNESPLISVSGEKVNGLSSYLVWVGVKFSNAKEEELLINDASQIGSKKFDFSIE